MQRREPALRTSRQSCAAGQEGPPWPRSLKNQAFPFSKPAYCQTNAAQLPGDWTSQGSSPWRAAWGGDSADSPSFLPPCPGPLQLLSHLGLLCRFPFKVGGPLCSSTELCWPLLMSHLLLGSLVHLHGVSHTQHWRVLPLLSLVNPTRAYLPYIPLCKLVRSKQDLWTHDLPHALLLGCTPLLSCSSLTRGSCAPLTTYLHRPMRSRHPVLSVLPPKCSLHPSAAPPAHCPLLRHHDLPPGQLRQPPKRASLILPSPWYSQTAARRILSEHKVKALKRRCFPGLSRWMLNAITCVLERDPEEHLTTNTLRRRWREMEADGRDVATSQGKPAATSSCKRQGTGSLLCLWRGCGGLLASRTCEKINSCCFKPPSIWWFVTAALGTNTACFLHSVAGWPRIPPGLPPPCTPPHTQAPVQNQVRAPNYPPGREQGSASVLFPDAHWAPRIMPGTTQAPRNNGWKVHCCLSRGLQAAETLFSITEATWPHLMPGTWKILIPLCWVNEYLLAEGIADCKTEEWKHYHLKDITVSLWINWWLIENGIWKKKYTFLS